MARKKKDSANTGKISVADMRKMINKRAGIDVAFNLNEENPTDVIDWISTGSRWLDSIICRGKLAGIPVGKVVELAGLESVGKSYMAAQIAAQAQNKNITVVYFDSESALDSTFLEKSGCKVEDVVYVQATNVEFVLETIEDLLGTGEQFLFIWDSMALTPAIADIEGDFNPQSTIAMKPRILAKGLSKLIQPIANTQSTLLILNQLKTNITMNVSEALTTPWMTPGGKALTYAYSLRIWLTGRKAKASFIEDNNGYRIGSEVKVKLEKSRFGTQGRTCNFKIVWGGDEIGIQDQESWLEAISSSEQFSGGAWKTITSFDGEKEWKFRETEWLEKLKDSEFKATVLDIIDREIVQKFDKREGSASNYYDSEEKDNSEEVDLDN